MFPTPGSVDLRLSYCWVGIRTCGDVWLGVVVNGFLDKSRRVCVFQQFTSVSKCCPTVCVCDNIRKSALALEVITSRCFVLFSFDVVVDVVFPSSHWSSFSSLCLHRKLSVFFILNEICGTRNLTQIQCTLKPIVLLSQNGYEDRKFHGGRGPREHQFTTHFLLHHSGRCITEQHRSRQTDTNKTPIPFVSGPSPPSVET